MAVDCELFPAAYRYYSSAPDATVKRMAAFHFDEMSPDTWSHLTIADKLGWYYDKTPALIDDSRSSTVLPGQPQP